MSNTSGKESHESRFAGRFWSKVERLQRDQCWEYQAGILPNGYGKFWKDNRSVVAHRVAFELVYGSIPDGMFVCHRCDNRRCCNPAHLFLGTPKDNSQDRDRKGRANNPSPEQCAKKLTWDMVARIRSLHATGTSTQLEIAALFDVSQTLISAIIRQKRWRTNQ